MKPVAHKIPLRVWLFGGDYKRVNGGISSRPSAARMIWRYFREGWWRHRPLRSWMDRHYYVARPDAPPKQPPKPKRWIDVAALFFALALAALPAAGQPPDCYDSIAAAAIAQARPYRNAAFVDYQVPTADGKSVAYYRVTPFNIEGQTYKARYGHEILDADGNVTGEAVGADGIVMGVQSLGWDMCEWWTPTPQDLDDVKFLTRERVRTTATPARPVVLYDELVPRSVEPVTECPKVWRRGPLVDTTDPDCERRPASELGLPEGMCCGVDRRDAWSGARTCWYSSGCVVGGQPPVEPPPTDPEPEPEPTDPEPTPDPEPAACDLAPVLDALARLELQVAELLARPVCPTAMEVEAVVADDFRDVGGAIVTITPARVVEAVRELRCGEGP